MEYKDIDKRKTAFIFELDNVLYPEKDYYFQVYYLFANMLEYVELTDAKAATKLLTDTYMAEGKDAAFNRLAEQFPEAGQYRDKFENQLLTAKLPLKLLLYQNMLTLMQEIVVDRKKLFIVTNGNIQEQINKIKQTEWHGLEKYLRCYFAEETRPKPEPDVMELIMKTDHLQRREMVMIGHSQADLLCAEACGIDYFDVDEFL
ncbi:phosphoglycolate phosphatase-like HAD superfamily hydrolase [Mucilaginibacter oryzae]|uniref:phosphoglycolate phosphatase n=1 Tax=Mucilaginibacter oryzae TaxID=468058 RepID=A0A316HI41_9SPHI|nr:HAD hydrolase-like protein [Mucilaginibacter oryzae]PWK79660.1 phosphoglycolate phosphatase-like HAD superfamily hydrolase [Mucilaginibacter oryzae]